MLQITNDVPRLMHPDRFAGGRFDPKARNRLPSRRGSQLLSPVRIGINVSKLDVKSQALRRGDDEPTEIAP